jgi:AraC family transcriptional regulator
VAGFSPFHFHRVFHTLTDETLNEMVLRLRLERAAALLRATPRLSITDAAFECGFQSVPVFSRAFKRYFGLNARQWDRQAPLKNSKNQQVFGDTHSYTLENLSDFAGRAEFSVRLRALPAQRLAYIRVYDSYNPASGIVEAYQRLVDWYCRRGGRA